MHLYKTASVEMLRKTFCFSVLGPLLLLVQLKEKLQKETEFPRDFL